MNVRQYGVDVAQIGNILVAVVLGLSLGTLIDGGTVTLPVVGTVGAVLAGGVGLAVGGVLYARLPDCDCCGGDGADACDCGDGCGC